MKGKSQHTSHKTLVRVVSNSGHACSEERWLAVLRPNNDNQKAGLQHYLEPFLDRAE